MTSICPGAISEFEGGSRWYVVNTLPKREFRAKLQLENQRFRIFLPKQLKTVRHARKLTNVAAPLFPGYLFVELDLRYHRWRSINGTLGVAGLIMRGEMPNPVPRGVVETMIASVDAQGLLRFERGLKAGGRVRLLAGPFAEHLGILDRVDDSDRIRVLLEIMGGPVPVHTRREFVVAA